MIKKTKRYNNLYKLITHKGLYRNFSVRPFFGFNKTLFVSFGINDERKLKLGTIDGVHNILNRFGGLQYQGTLNRVYKRIIRDCNDAAFLESENQEVLLPNFSCHNLRHTFATRLCESGANI